MNDPFDPYFFLETEFKNRAQFLSWVKEYHPDELRWIKANVSPESFAAGFIRVRDNFDRRRKNTYLFSTSAEDETIHPKENLYLWGHYGYGHRGIALEFNTENLGNDVLAHGDPEARLGMSVSDVWVKVDYKTQVSPLSYKTYLDFILSGPPSEENDASPGVRSIVNFLEQTLKTKHTVWRLENEWRLLWNSSSGNDVYFCPISERSIAGIYLGLRINDVEKERILAAARTNMPNVPVEQAVKAEGNFALQWNRIS